MAYTVQDVLAIEEAIKSGALRVTFGDRTVQYQSLDDLKKLRSEMISEIDAEANPDRPAKRRTYRVYQSGTGYGNGWVW